MARKQVGPAAWHPLPSSREKGGCGASCALGLCRFSSGRRLPSVPRRWPRARPRGPPFLSQRVWKGRLFADVPLHEWRFDGTDICPSLTLEPAWPACHTVSSQELRHPNCFVQCQSCKKRVSDLPVDACNCKAVASFGASLLETVRRLRCFLLVERVDSLLRLWLKFLTHWVAGLASVEASTKREFFFASSRCT